MLPKPATALASSENSDAPYCELPARADTLSVVAGSDLHYITLHAPLNQEWSTPFRSQREAHWGI
jgi:hypothetical protein